MTWGAVPSSVVALSTGLEGGRRPRRKRGPRGTRRRTPRWFHAVKAVRFFQQLRIAAPPTTDIHIRTIRHPCGGGRGAAASVGRGRGGGFQSFGGTGDDVFLVKGSRPEGGADRGFRVSGVYLYELYSVAVFTRIDVARIDMLGLLLKKLYVTN